MTYEEDTMEQRLPPERIEAILNAKKERNGFHVASSDYDDLVLAYKQQRDIIATIKADRENAEAESGKFRNDADKWYGKFVDELTAHKRCLEILRDIHDCMVRASETGDPIEVDSRLAGDIAHQLRLDSHNLT